MLGLMMMERHAMQNVRSCETKKGMAVVSGYSKHTSAGASSTHATSLTKAERSNYSNFKVRMRYKFLQFDRMPPFKMVAILDLQSSDRLASCRIKGACISGLYAVEKCYSEG